MSIGDDPIARVFGAPQPGEGDEPSPMQFRAYVCDGCVGVLVLAITDQGVVPAVGYAKIEGEGSFTNGPVLLNALTGPALIAGERAHRHAVNQVEMRKIQVEARDHVERARLGDQNAIATLVEVRENAKKGDPRAKYVHAVALDYAKNKPVLESFSPGAEMANTSAPHLERVLGVVGQGGERASADPLGYAIILAACLPAAGVNLPTAIVLANGPPLFRSRIESVAGAFGSDDERQAFLSAASGRLPHRDRLSEFPLAIRHALGAGAVVAKARRLQALRHEPTPLGQIDRHLAAELGA